MHYAFVANGGHIGVTNGGHIGVTNGGHIGDFKLVSSQHMSFVNFK